jgi:Tfp pilus assembly protein PilO
VLANRTAKWSAGTAALCAVLLVATWFLLVTPRRAAAAETRAAQAAAQQANDVLRAKLQQLRAQFADLPRTQAELAKLHQQVTPTADLADVVRSVSALSSAAGTTLEGIAPSAPTAVGGASAGRAATGGTSNAVSGGASGGAASTAAASGSGSGSSADGTASAARGVIDIPLSITVTGDYYQVVGFIRRVQTEMSRALLIGGVQINQEEAGATVRLNLTGHVFTLPETGTTAGVSRTASAGSSSARSE